MPEVSTFAIAADGSRLAVGDGPEVLVYLTSGQPAWKHFCEGILVGVAFAGPHLVTVDSAGLVTFFRMQDGRVVQQSQLDGVIKGCCVSPDAVFCVVTSAGLVVVQPNGETFAYPFNQASVATFGPDRNSLGVGTPTGEFYALDGSDGSAWGSQKVPGEVTDAIWNPRGFWMFTAGTTLYCCDGGAAAITAQVDVEAPARGVAVTLDGAVAAVLTPPGKIALVELHQYRVAGFVNVRREVQNIALSGTKLGIGFDDGDASTVDLISRSTVRTEPHPGRGRNNWNLDLAYDTVVLAGAITSLRAGGQPVAEAQYYQGEDYAGGRRGYWGVGCLLVNVLWLTCAGFIGLAFLVNYVRSM